MRLKDPTLRRFWIVIDEEDGGHPYGVTAIDLPDALGLIARSGYCHRLPPVVRRVIEDVDVSTVPELNDRRPWMAPPIWRGIWYPNDGSIYLHPRDRRY